MVIHYLKLPILLRSNNRFLYQSILYISDIFHKWEKFGLLLRGEQWNKINIISQMANVWKYFLHKVKLDWPKDWKQNLSFFRMIFIVMSHHFWRILWLQLWRVTNWYVWLEIYPWETISSDPVSYGLSPLEELQLQKNN